MRICLINNGRMVGIAIDPWGILWITRAQAERLFDLLGMALIDITDEELDALLSSED